MNKPCPTPFCPHLEHNPDCTGSMSGIGEYDKSVQPKWYERLVGFIVSLFMGRW